MEPSTTNPITTLMKEHRLIERMLELINKQVKKMEDTKELDTTFIDLFVDFFEQFTERSHEAKEENILFVELEKKELKPEHHELIKKLMHEHDLAREHVGKLVDAEKRYMTGELGALQEVCDILKALTKFYPPHIDKEDNHFYVPVMDYFSEEEILKMTKRFDEHDQTGVYQKYDALMGELEKTYG